MKKRLLILLGLAIVAGGCVFYFAKHRARQHPLARLAQLPTAKVHRHVSPTGEVVEHVHVYDSPEQSESDGTSGDVVTSSGAVKDYMKMNPIQRAWTQLDLEAIKRKWQPYTIEQMHEMWEQQETLTREAFPETYVYRGYGGGSSSGSGGG